MNVDSVGGDGLDVAVSDDGLVAWARIDRPERRNALDQAVLSGLRDVADAADQSEVRVVVVRGAGEAFSAGGDVTELPPDGSARAYRETFGRLSQAMSALRESSALTVAAVDGDCLAGAVGLAAACEFVVASESAAFGTPEVDVGLFPLQAMVPLLRTVPEKRGLKMLFTGERVGAREARDLGLVTEVYPDHEFEEGVSSFVDALAASSPLMIEAGKAAYYRQRDLGFDAALDHATDVLSLLATSRDVREGIEALADGRDPEWTRR